MGYKERFNFTRSNISENLGGSLPPIDLVQIDFHDRLKAEPRLDSRIRLAMNYAHLIEDSLGIDNQSLAENLRNPRRDLVSILFLDAVRILGEEHFLSGELIKPNQVKAATAEEITGSAQARKNMQGRLDYYLGLFKAAGSNTKYDALEAIMYEAACLLLDRYKLSGFTETVVRGQLSGMLAEHKVIDAVRKGGYSLVRYGSPEEDFNDRADIILAAPDHNLPVPLSLQVKGRSSLDQLFIVRENSRGNLDVHVPMHRSLDQFSLTEEQALRLLSIINTKVARLTSFNRRWGSGTIQ